VDITMGDEKRYLKNQDTIPSVDTAGVFGTVVSRLTPVVNQVKTTAQTLDSLMRNINSIFDPAAKNNLQSVLANFNRISANLVVSTASLQALMNQQSGSLSKSMNNLSSFTKNLADNNDKITATMANLETSTRNLSKADIDGTVNQLRATIERLNTAVEKIDSKEGSLGLLLNDNQLYDNLAKTTRSLNILMDDIRVNPKRYVSISIFGGKAKKQYLTSPLPAQDTITPVTMK